MDQLIKNISQLHPIAQIALIVGGAVIVAIFVWQYFKTIREA